MKDLRETLDENTRELFDEFEKLVHATGQKRSEIFPEWSIQRISILQVSLYESLLRIEELEKKIRVIKFKKRYDSTH